MKGFLFILVFLGGAVVCAINYLEYKKTGSIPIQQWFAHIQSSAIPSLKNSVKSATGDSSPATVKISKWTDANGVVHYENRPVDGAKTIEVEPNKNILPPAPVVELPETAKSKPKTMNEEVRALQEAKDARMEAIINQ
jgi:hypothetical protein